MYVERLHIHRLRSICGGAWVMHWALPPVQARASIDTVTWEGSQTNQIASMRIPGLWSVSQDLPEFSMPRTRLATKTRQGIDAVEGVQCQIKRMARRMRFRGLLASGVCPSERVLCHSPQPVAQGKAVEADSRCCSQVVRQRWVRASNHTRPPCARAPHCYVGAFGAVVAPGRASAPQEWRPGRQSDREFRTVDSKTTSRPKDRRQSCVVPRVFGGLWQTSRRQGNRNRNLR